MKRYLRWIYNGAHVLQSKTEQFRKRNMLCPKPCQRVVTLWNPDMRKSTANTFCSSQQDSQGSVNLNRQDMLRIYRQHRVKAAAVQRDGAVGYFRVFAALIIVRQRPEVTADFSRPRNIFIVGIRRKSRRERDADRFVPLAGFRPARLTPKLINIPL